MVFNAFLGVLTQHFRWYLASFATASLEFGIVLILMKKLLSPSNSVKLSILEPVSRNSTLCSFPPSCWHMMQAFLLWTSVLDRSVFLECSSTGSSDDWLHLFSFCGMFGSCWLTEKDDSYLSFSCYYIAALEVY